MLSIALGTIGSIAYLSLGDGSHVEAWYRSIAGQPGVDFFNNVVRPGMAGSMDQFAAGFNTFYQWAHATFPGSVG